MVDRKFLAEQQVFYYCLPSSSRQDCETWASYVIEDGEQWHTTHPNMPHCSLHDFTATAALPSAMRHTIVNVNKHFARTAIPAVFVAVVLQKNFGFRVGSLFVERELNRIDPKLKLKVFFEEAKALNWLADSYRSHVTHA